MKPHKTRTSYKKGFVNVGQGHELYYECYGNPKAKPVLFLHGGPGGGFRKTDKRFFNPKKFNVIFFDQRGCGKSKPFASLKNNKTANLVEDCKKLLAFLGLEKVFLFGGSWGSTLGLCYAIKYPETVSGMLLRGIFLSNSQDLDYFIEGPAREMFPKQWQRFIENVPKTERRQIVEFYAKKINSKNKKISKKYGFEFAVYEQSIMRLEYDQKKVLKKLKKWKKNTWPLIESHYLANKCFLPENHILKNAHKISNIPTIIVHGRYDCVCSPKSALKLHKKLKKSRLTFVAAGHSASDKAIEQKILAEMKKLE